MVCLRLKGMYCNPRFLLVYKVQAESVGAFAHAVAVLLLHDAHGRDDFE